MAKREMQDAIMRRVAVLEKKRSEDRTGNTHEKWMTYTSKIEALEEARSFVRNYMLWDTSND